MVNPAQVWDALAAVSDPEYPLSIIELGLVYDVRVTDGGAIDIDLTFTSIGCPAIDMIVDDIRETLKDVDGVADLHIEVVWNPPWTKDQISEKGKRVLEMYGVAN